MKNTRSRRYVNITYAEQQKRSDLIWWQLLCFDMLRVKCWYIWVPARRLWMMVSSSSGTDEQPRPHPRIVWFVYLSALACPHWVDALSTTCSFSSPSLPSSTRSLNLLASTDALTIYTHIYSLARFISLGSFELHISLHFIFHFWKGIRKGRYGYDQTTLP